MNHPPMLTAAEYAALAQSCLTNAGDRAYQQVSATRGVAYATLAMAAATLEAAAVRPHVHTPHGVKSKS